MLSVNIISFVIFTIHIANSELSEDIKNNIKFQCGDLLVIGGGHGHIYGEERDELFFSTQKYFALEEAIKKEDHLKIRYGIRCGENEKIFPDVEICDALESNDNSTNLSKSFINLYGFNATSCPIPFGFYTSRQENILDASLINLVGETCNEDDDFWGTYGFINAAIIDDDKRIINGFWQQVPKDDPNYQKCDSIVYKIFISGQDDLTRNRKKYFQDAPTNQLI